MKRVGAAFVLGSVLAMMSGCATASGRQPLFQALRPDDSEDIYSLEFDTRATVRVTRGGRNYASSFPIRSPRGDKIAFVRQAGYDRLLLLDVRRRKMQELPPIGRRLGAPAWSPDGRKLLVAAGESAEDFRLHIVPVDRSGPTRPLEVPAGVYDCGTWSPDGQSIVATRRVGELSEVVIVRESIGAADVLVSSTDVAYHCPEWAPGGERIGISIYDRSYLTASIGLIDLRSGELSILDAGPGVNNAPRWSSAGDWLLFQCTEGLPPERTNTPEFFRAMEICAIRPDGTGRRRLTSNDYFDAHPSW